MPLYENESQDFSRRLLLLGGLQGGLFLVLAGRLQYLQVARSDVYATLAEAIGSIFRKSQRRVGALSIAMENCWPIMTAIFKSALCPSGSVISTSRCKTWHKFSTLMQPTVIKFGAGLSAIRLLSRW